ncbi:aminoglycoside phosphotransferase [Streptomyces sp. NPDC020965]|uniref:aminoglycoside phosphotransferase n=1 Tax=Streptomyces sp. NPDC020965 TaxID=3365105 RepID=UPI00378B90D7
MSTERVSFEELPASRREVLAKRFGPILDIANSPGCPDSEVAARIVTPQGRYEVKGVRTDHPRVTAQAREAAVNPAVARVIAPRLRWRAVRDGWDLNVFDALDGRPADHRPGSADLPLVADLLTTVSELRAPATVEPHLADQRLTRYAASPADLDRFRGDHLCHTDLTDENVLVADGRAWLVDWTRATRGAAWLDSASWIIWLISAGRHTPSAAERQATEIPAFRQAPPAAVTAFAEAGANLWEEITASAPDPWSTSVYVAAQSWLTHRRGL